MKKILCRKRLLWVVVTFLMILLVGCSNMADRQENEELFQVSTLNALMQGYYDGEITVAKLLQNGDTGLGTFDTLDGEMIVCDGVVYQAKADGSVQIANDEITTPFACVTFFDQDITLDDLSGASDLQELKTYLDQSISAQDGSGNLFYMAKIEGEFSMIHLRSVPAQGKPYRELAQIADEQQEFFHKDVLGCLIAVRCPEYVAGINMPGWHIHFLSADYTMGGHVLDLAMIQGAGYLDITPEFDLLLPQTAAFAGLDLTQNMQDQTVKVEGK
jgi:acetolactate decarboxylase